MIRNQASSFCSLVEQLFASAYKEICADCGVASAPSENRRLIHLYAVQLRRRLRRANQESLGIVLRSQGNKFELMAKKQKRSPRPV